MVASSASRSCRVISLPSTPCSSTSSSRDFKLSNSASKRSISMSSSLVAFNMRYFCVSSSMTCVACRVVSYADSVSSYWLFNACNVRDSFRSESSASLIRRPRDCWRDERESFIRASDCLSGWMLKLLMVWWMSYTRRVSRLINTLSTDGSIYAPHTVAGSSSRSILKTTSTCFVFSLRCLALLRSLVPRNGRREVFRFKALSMRSSSV